MELNKAETATRLGVTTRAIERYMSTERPPEQRLVPVRYQPGRGGQQPVFDSEVVDAFKVRMEQAAQEKRDKPANSDTQALARQVRPDALQALAALIQNKPAGVPVEAKLYLTIHECSELSGLSQKEIREAVKSGALKSRRGRRGAVVVGRNDLIAWAAA